MDLQEKLIKLYEKTQMRKREFDLSLKYERQACKAKTASERKKCMTKAREHAQKARLLKPYN